MWKVAVAFAALLVPADLAQATEPAKTTNAALRYWIAFAAMQNPPADAPTANLLEQVATGAAPWDEARLGSILQQNKEAIETMQRATRLPDCDWGLEDDLGQPIRHLAKGRALARLNALYGARLAAGGEIDKAVDAWLAGVRFSRDLSRDGALISALVGAASLSVQLDALIRSVGEGKASVALLARVSDAVGNVPAYGVDWSRSLVHEEQSTGVWLDRMAVAPPPEVYASLQFMLGGAEPADTSAIQKVFAPKLLLEPSEASDEVKLHAAIRRMRDETRAALRGVRIAYGLQYVRSLPAISQLEAEAGALLPATRDLLFSFDRPNHVRAELETKRVALLGLIALGRRRLQGGPDPLSLEGLGVPEDPFSGRQLRVAATPKGDELRSAGQDAKGNALVFRLAR
ncbi:MAG: hypothetical protein ACHQNV_07680 [Vicinamibacteria bacterium]